MIQDTSETLLSKLSQFVAKHMGLHFPKERFSDLERGIGYAAREFDFNDAESCIGWLLSSKIKKSQIDILASHLTVGETYFFRDENVFNALELHILPELIHSRRKTGKRLRLWSAGCASGEEPYSLAILLLKMIPDLSDWNITILATDINPRFLKRASDGIYTKWSFRGTPEWVKDRYFRRTKDGHYRIDPLIKKMVRFSYLNLMDDCYPSLTNNTNAMDVIFCRNVVMYFAEEYVRQVIGRMYRSHAKAGWMIMSPGEMHQQFYSQFNTVHLQGAILYRKDDRQAPTEELTELQTTLPIPETPVDSQTYPQQEILFPEQMDTTDEIIPQPLEALPEPPETQAPAQPFYEGALASFERGHYAEAAEILLELLSNDQSNPNAMALLARTYANQGDLSGALEWCEKAISTDKLNPSFHYLLSTIMAELGRVEDAIAALKNVLYLDYNSVLAYFALGNINRQQGKLKEAEKNFDNAISLLSGMQTEETLPESEGITAGRLMEIIKFSSNQEAVHE